jgi:PPOX class F420-dependent enzyme/OxyR family protein
MPLDEIYGRYLREHSQGRLATLSPAGSLQVKPVGYRYNAELAAVDIGGYAMERSAKYRNIGQHSQVAFLVDDTVGEGPAGMRFLELRGHAEQATAGPGAEPGLSRQLIRIHPRRLVAWNIDPGRPGLHTATIPADSGLTRPQTDRPGVSSARPVLDLGDGAAWEAGQAAAALAAELQAGWDARDAGISNRHFAADIIWGSPFGAAAHGYDDLHAIHVRLKRHRRGGAVSRYEVGKVLAPAPGVAIAQIRRTALSQHGQPVETSGDLTGAFSETALYVLVRRGGTWWVAAGQNTPVLPPPPR